MVGRLRHGDPFATPPGGLHQNLASWVSLKGACLPERRSQRMGLLPRVVGAGVTDAGAGRLRRAVPAGRRRRCGDRRRTRARMVPVTQPTAWHAAGLAVWTSLDVPI